MSTLDEIPNELLLGSISNREIVLPYPEVIARIRRLPEFGLRVLGWEGWLRYPHGQVGHSTRHPGTVDLSGLSAPGAAELCMRTIEDAHAAALREPERGELYFCVTVTKS